MTILKSTLTGRDNLVTDRKPRRDWCLLEWLYGFANRTNVVIVTHPGEIPVKSLSEQPRHRLPESRIHQLAWLVEVVVNDGLRIDAERVIHRGQELHGVDRLLGR